MKYTQYVYTVRIRRDAVPGWNNRPEDFERWLQVYLTDTLGHYRPSVEFMAEVEE